MDNTKPELVLEAFYAFLHKDFDPLDIHFKRLDLLTQVDEAFISLDQIGKEIG